MKRIIILLFLISILIFPVTGKELVRIDPADFGKLSQYMKGIDVAGRNPEYLDIVVDAEDIASLNAAGILYEKLTVNTNKMDWLSLQDAYDYMDSLHTLYPSITDMDTLGYTAQDNNPLIILKINGSSPSVQNTRLGFLLMGMHHAREWQTVSAALFFADSLLCNYGTDSSITALIDSTFIVVYPVVNPDGYDYSRTVNNMWRKNRTYRNGSYGVDPNRNYGGSLNGDARCDWGFIANSSTTHYPSNDVYCGPYPNSEREVQSVVQLIDDYEFDISISLHSYGELVIWPWGAVTYAAPDSVLYEYLGTEMANEILQKDNSGYYSPGQSVGLYPTTGDSDDWIYGWTKSQKGRTTMAFTFEIDNSFNSSTAEELDTLCRRVYKGIYRGLELCGYAQANVIEFPLKPELSSLGDSLSWTAINSSQADFFTCSIKDSLYLFTDTENNISYYTLDNVSQDASNPYSGSYSFKDSPQNSSTSVIMTAERTAVESGTVFTISRYYSIETDYDFAFGEMSKDGYLWTVIDTNKTIYNGVETSWQTDSVDLSGYAGDEYYFRVRAVYDGGVLNEGIYIDNMGPITAFAADSVYNDSINDTLIIIDEGIEGQYYFTVTPYMSDIGYLIESDRELMDIVSMIEEHFEPMPVNNENNITVSFNRHSKSLHINTEMNHSINLYNTLGANVQSSHINGSSTIDISGLKPGKYFIFADNTRVLGILILK